MSDPRILRTEPPSDAAPSGDTAPYDLSRPRAVPQRRRRELEVATAQLAKAYEALLTARFSSRAEVGASAIEAASLGPFLAAIPDPPAAFVFEAEGAPAGCGVLDFGHDFAAFLVERLFGGRGDWRALERPLTALEWAALRGLADRWLALAADALQTSGAWRPRPATPLAEGEARPTTTGEIPLLVLVFEIRCGEFTGNARLALPSAWLVEGRSAGEGAAAPAADAEETRRRIRAHLEQARLRVEGRLPELRLRVRDVSELQPGRVLLTGRRADEPVEVRINGRLVFLAQLGRTHGHVGLQITQDVDGGAPPERPRDGRIQ